jgi:hypothetical protein
MLREYTRMMLQVEVLVQIQKRFHIHISRALHFIEDDLFIQLLKVPVSS